MASWLLVILTTTFIVAHVVLDWSHAPRGPSPADAGGFRSATADGTGWRGRLLDDL